MLAAQPRPLQFRLVDVTKAAGIAFTHDNGAFGKKYLPETLGSGAAFLDYDNDGRQDILLVNGTAWPGQPAGAPSYSRLYRNEGDGSFRDVTAAAGLAVELYGMGVAVADFDNDGWQDILITAVGQSRLFRNTGKGTFVDVTEKTGSARAGLQHVGDVVRLRPRRLARPAGAQLRAWTPETDVHCSVDGKQKSYCTPEAYRGTTVWLFRNTGKGTFEDVTAKAGLFDATSKSLGVTLIDYDGDIWPDVFIANDTQPNKLYRNNGNGTFSELALQAGLAFSEEGRARAGMGVDAGDVDNSGRPADRRDELLGRDGRAVQVGRRRAVRRRLAAHGRRAGVAAHARVRVLLLRRRPRRLPGPAGRERPHRRDRRAHAGARELRRAAAPVPQPGRRQVPRRGHGARRRVRRAEGGPRRGVRRHRRRRRPRRDHHDQRRAGVPVPERRDDGHQRDPPRRCAGRSRTATPSAPGCASIAGDQRYTRMVRTGSSYLSQSELPLSFGLGRRNAADRVVIEWPSGLKEELPSLAAGHHYDIVEGKGVVGRKPLTAMRNAEGGIRN
jgi:enediyne biosynthesis protein E4